MIPVASWILAALIAMGNSHSGPGARSITVKRLCGKVESVDYSKPNYLRKNLRGVRITLYRRDAETPCCGTLAPLAVATTSRWGNFKFKRMTAGSYWIAAQIDRRDYHTPVQLEPPKDGTVAICSDNTYDLDDSGNFGLAQYITVD